MPFLEVLTRTYKRPKMLVRNQASLRVQTDNDYLQTLLDDPTGAGIGWSYTNMMAYAPHLVGEYIWILDDDDLCVRPTLIEELKTIVEAHRPDVIMVKMDHKERGILPNICWQKRPELGGLGCSSFIVKRHIWQKHARNFSASYAGDFDFIQSVFARNYETYWHDVIASQVQRISLGVTE